LEYPKPFIAPSPFSPFFWAVKHSSFLSLFATLLHIHRAISITIHVTKGLFESKLYIKNINIRGNEEDSLDKIINSKNEKEKPYYFLDKIIPYFSDLTSSSLSLFIFSLDSFLHFLKFSSNLINPCFFSSISVSETEDSLISSSIRFSSSSLQFFDILMNPLENLKKSFSASLFHNNIYRSPLIHLNTPITTETVSINSLYKNNDHFTLFFQPALSLNSYSSTIPLSFFYIVLLIFYFVDFVLQSEWTPTPPSFHLFLSKTFLSCAIYSFVCFENCVLHDEVLFIFCFLNYLNFIEVLFI
jgi:hypothetical protein